MVSAISHERIGVPMNNDRQLDRSRKRSHIEMSYSNYEGRSQWPHRGQSGSSSSTSHQHPLSLPVPQSRYHGHGFDFRRPIMSTNTPSGTEEVVDLTNEPDSPPFQFSRRQPARSHSANDHRPPHRHRPPRFGRNIMADVVDLEEDGDEDQVEPTEIINLDPPSSPEVQFVRATARPPTLAAPSHLLDVINFQGFLSTQEAFRQEIALQTRRMGRFRPSRPDMDEIYFSGSTNPNVDLTIDLDYQAPGFTIHEPPPPPPPPSYKPPSPAPEGFTRTVGEDDVVVCPNCDRELGIGDGPRQQIWVAKPCGHVYCGECTNNRAMSKKKTTASFSPLRTTNPFSKCKVAGCEKSVSQPKSMIQIYL